MKQTGIIRRIDDLGRIVIPKEIRRTMQIQEGDALEIYIGEDSVIFKKAIVDFYCYTKRGLLIGVVHEQPYKGQEFEFGHEKYVADFRVGDNHWFMEKKSLVYGEDGE